MGGDRWAIVFHLGRNESAIVDGVVHSEGARDLSFAVRDAILDPRGHDQAGSSRIWDEGPVIAGSEQVIQFPAQTWVISAHPL